MPPKTQKQTESQTDVDISSLTMESIQAMMDRVTLNLNSTMNANMIAMEERMNAKIEANRSRPSSPAPQMTPQQSTQSQSQSTPKAVQATQPAAVQSDDKRWRPEEIGYFDGSSDKVYAFTDRLTSVAASKSVKLIQTNLVTVLQETAFSWYHIELEDHIRFAYNTSTSIDPWCQALIRRFGPTQNELMKQLEECHYTRKDAANKKDATVYIQSILRITKGLKWPQENGLMTAFHHFEPGLQRDLDPPSDLTAFIKQVQLRQDAWFQVYSAFGKPRPPDPRPPQPMRT